MRKPTWFRPRPNMRTPCTSAEDAMMFSVGAGIIFSPDARMMRSSVLPTLSLDSNEHELDVDMMDNLHLPYVLGWMLYKHVRCRVSFHVR